MLILPPTPTVPQLDEVFPPIAVTKVFASIPSEFQIVIDPPLPPGVVPVPPFEVMMFVVDVATVTDPPLPPLPELLSAPFAKIACMDDEDIVMSPAFVPEVVAVVMISLVVAFCIVRVPPFEVVVPVMIMFLRVIVRPLPSKVLLRVNGVPDTMSFVVSVLP
jgi:hypothetical protein